MANTPLKQGVNVVAHFKCISGETRNERSLVTRRCVFVGKFMVFEVSIGNENSSAVLGPISSLAARRFLFSVGDDVRNL